MIIDLGIKLTSINFDQFISKNWEESFSEKTKVVDFSLKKLEWIGFEQLTFVTSWIERLITLKKHVNLYLQDASDISSQSDTYKKRQKCLKLILLEWKIQNLLSDKIKPISGGINVSSSAKISTSIPFEYIPVINYHLDTFEDEFSNLYKKHLKQFKIYSENEIKANTSLSYFDNKFLNYSIVKELYANVCQHAYSQEDTEKKCYISLFHNKKIERPFSPDVLNKLLKARYSERSKEETNYFLDSKGNFTNKSYLEFTFLDFGIGISETLKEKYQSENFDRIKEKLSTNHEKQNIDSKVLEYSFLLFTSKYEFAEDLKIHDYIPRGLYIIKDIVKRYKGLIIARSKKGKVIFDFSKVEYTDIRKCIHFRENDNAEEISDFPGTSITILLPTTEQSIKDYTSFKREISSAPQLKFLNILKLYTNNNKHFVSDEKENEKLFYENFFNELCTILGDLNLGNKHSLVCFDFAGISNEKQGFYTKLTYFLSYSPLINENINALLFNVLDKGINEAQLEFEKRPNSIGFFHHVIPCIHPDLNVSWIGIHNKYLASRLTENWKGDNRYEQNSIDNPESISGNVLKIFSNGENSIVKCSIPEYQNITEEIIKYQKGFIDNEVKNKGISFDDLIYAEQSDVPKTHDYNLIFKTDPEGRAFLTANGKYQMVFLSFIEKLYKKEYRRLIATYFVFNFFNDSKIGYDIKNKINKILTVTLSSQLLGKEVKDILEILSKPKPVEISLIPLSSYYDFYKEQRFEEIVDDDKILVVNDVISTGFLSQQIYNSINKRRKNVSVTILTIVDSRQPDEKVNALNDIILSLTEFPIEKINPEDFKSEKEPVWINPILNAPITMSVEKSNIQNILLHPNEFLECVKNESFYKVGLFKKNTVYHTYYLETDKLFQEISEWENNTEISLLQLLIERLQERKNIDDKNNFKEHISKICLDIDSFQKQNKYLSDIEAVPNLKHFLGLFDKEINISAKFDFVFYPFLSATSFFENKINTILENFKGNNSIEIYPIPRIMTPKGWRFTFPPKFLNHITIGKNILILDDGSCSGETIVQMIDTISFLDVRDITVLSVFARLEDYNREFLTRINEIKVKHHTIPVKVYFGTHFNIPIYNKTNNPYSMELLSLDKYDSTNIPSAVKEYIEKRKNQIRSFLENKEITYPLIPDFVSKKEMFRLRNIIGRFDSYRLYKEDDPLGRTLDGTPKPTKEYLIDVISTEQGLNALIGVLVHEPKLIDTLNRVYPTIIKSLKKKLELLFNEEYPLNKFNNKIFYLRILSFINLKVLLNPDTVLKLFKQMDREIREAQDEKIKKSIYDSFNYYAFILYCIYENKLINYENHDKEDIHNLLSIFLEKISTNALLPSGNEYVFQNLFREFLEDYRKRISTKNHSTVISAFIQMYNYFYDDLGKDSHPILFSQFQDFFIEYFNATSIEVKEKAKKYYEEILLKIINKIIPRTVLILGAFKPFKSYIHIVDVEEYLELIQTANTNIKRLLETKADNTDINSQINRTIYDSFEKFNNLILDYNSPFFKLIKDFRFDPFTLHKEIQNKESIKKELEQNNIELNIEYKTNKEIIFILSHPIFFNVIYEEIPANAIRHAKGAKCLLTLELKENSLSINYKQNLPKIPNMGERGIRGFKKIATTHNATFEEFHINGYEFIFEFPLNLMSN